MIIIADLLNHLGLFLVKETSCHGYLVNTEHVEAKVTDIKYMY